MQTGLPAFRLPASFVRLEKDHPAWDLKSLDEYRVLYRTFTDGDREQRVYFLYRQQANILFVLYRDIPARKPTQTHRSSSQNSDGWARGSGIGQLSGIVAVCHKLCQWLS